MAGSKKPSSGHGRSHSRARPFTGGRTITPRRSVASSPLRRGSHRDGALPRDPRAPSQGRARGGDGVDARAARWLGGRRYRAGTLRSVPTRKILTDVGGKREALTGPTFTDRSDFTPSSLVRHL